MHGQLALQRKLNEALTNARLRNRAYSLRAFARKLEISPAALSEILNGKRNVSKRLAERLVTNLVLSPNEAKAILDLFPEPGESRRPVRMSAPEFGELSNDQFHLASDWHYFAILALAETADFKAEPQWISSRLNIKLVDAQNALIRLERLKLIAIDAATGIVQVLKPQAALPQELAALASRKAHSQNLDLANRSLERDDVSERDFTAITMAIDVKKLALARGVIREFREKLRELLESGDRTEVYKLCVQLIPLSNLRSATNYTN